jgi:hypothetical protein
MAGDPYWCHTSWWIEQTCLDTWVIRYWTWFDIETLWIQIQLVVVFLVVWNTMKHVFAFHAAAIWTFRMVILVNLISWDGKRRLALDFVWWNKYLYVKYTSVLLIHRIMWRIIRIYKYRCKRIWTLRVCVYTCMFLRCLIGSQFRLSHCYYFFGWRRCRVARQDTKKMGWFHPYI